MLAKFPIYTRFLNGGKLCGRGGEAVYGFLLHQVAKISEKYAQYLHDSKGVKPISISPLILERGCDGWELKDGYLHIKEGVNARIIISALDETTISILMKALIDIYKQKEVVNIGGIKGVIEEVCIKEKEGAKFERYAELIKKAKKNREVTFKFLTPTSFRQKGIQATFPLPEHVFLSLLSTWNAFSEVKIPESIKEKFKSIGVSQYHLYSEMWNFSKYKILGCRGSVEYAFKNNFTEGELKILNALSRFANFSGVGYKRTMGMGMVEVQNVEKTS
jgi:CRISPR-associated endoribonuclease Cas6